MYTNVIWVKQGGRNYKTHVPRALNRFQKLSCYLPAVMSYYHHTIFFFFFLSMLMKMRALWMNYDLTIGI